jgi:hypothetical protein
METHASFETGECSENQQESSIAKRVCGNQSNSHIPETILEMKMTGIKTTRPV